MPQATKAKLNPCEQTPELCSKISLRVAVINSVLKTKGNYHLASVNNN